MAGANSLTGKAARPGTGDSHVVPPTAQHVIRSTVPEAQRYSELFSILLYNYLLEITSHKCQLHFSTGSPATA